MHVLRTQRYQDISIQAMENRIDLSCKTTDLKFCLKSLVSINFCPIRQAVPLKLRVARDDKGEGDLRPLLYFCLVIS